MHGRTLIPNSYVLATAATTSSLRTFMFSSPETFKIKNLHSEVNIAIYYQV